MTLLVVDAGTSACRASVVDLDLGILLSHAVPWQDWTRRGQLSQFDPWHSFLVCVEELMRRGVDPGFDAVTFTSMRDAIVILDATGDILASYPSTYGSAPLSHEAIPRAFARCGQRHPLATSVAIRPLSRAAIAKLVPLADYLGYRLTGHLVTTPSLGASLGVLDIESSSWSSEMIASAGLQSSWLPDIVPAGTLVGYSRDQVAPLANRIPVFATGADTPLALLTLCTDRAKDVALLGGSFWQTVAVSSEPFDRSVLRRVSPHVVPGQWTVEYSSSGVGIALSNWSLGSYEIVDDALRESAPDVDVTVSLDDGRLSVSIKAPLLSRSLTEIAQAVLSATLRYGCSTVSDNISRLLDDLALARSEVSLHVTGGIARSTLFGNYLQALCPVQSIVTHHPEMTTLGGAAIAWTELGAFNNLDTARQWASLAARGH